MTSPKPHEPNADSVRAATVARADELLHILARRWPTVIAVIVVVAGAAFMYSSSQPARYAASADVLLSRQNLAASVNNISDPGLVGGDLNRVAQTEANLATAPAVMSGALKRLGLPQSGAGELRRNSTATADPTSDILTFRVENSDPTTAVSLVEALANSYTTYRRALDNAGVDRALQGVRARLKAARTADRRNGTLITSLRANEDRLATLAAFQGSRAFVVRTPQAASKISPKPRRALALGLLFGAILASGLVLLRHRLDTRVADPDEVAEQLGMPLLAKIPKLPKKLRQSHHLVMLSDPDGLSAEAFRMLRTNVEFATIDGDAKTIMVSSAVQAEGKSTTLANLALAFARGGKRVILVDLDLRRPYVARFFDLQGRPGLSEVALGRFALHEALTEIDISRPQASKTSDPEANGHGDTQPLSATRQMVMADRDRGGLRVLTSGPMPPDTGEFVSSERVKHLLADLERDADVVLIDAPPLLSVNDALALSQIAGALLLVARIGIVRRPMFKDIRRVLDRSPARVLGCVVTGVQANLAYGYQYGYGYSSTNDGLRPAPDANPPVTVA